MKYENPGVGPLAKFLWGGVAHKHVVAKYSRRDFGLGIEPSGADLRAGEISRFDGRRWIG